MSNGNGGGGGDPLGALIGGTPVLEMTSTAWGYHDPPQTVLDQARNAGATIRNTLVNEYHVSAWVADAVGGITIAAVLLVGYVFGPLAGILATIGAELADNILQTIINIRKSDNPVLEQLTNDSLTEFFGFDFSGVASHRRTGRSIIERADDTGGKVLQLFETELLGNQAAPLHADSTTAARWLGFNVDFSIYTALLSAIAEIASLNYMTELRELGQNVAQNLGLGRMTRQVMMPLIKTGVQIPYTRALNRRYRPTLLSRGEAAHALIAGYKPDAEYLDISAQEGYSDVDSGILVELERKKVPVADLERLVRYGVTTQENAIAEVKADFYTDTTAQWSLTAAALARVDAIETETAKYWETLVLQGVLDTGTYSSLLDQLHWTEPEKRAQLALTGNKLEYPRKFLTLAEVQQAFYTDTIALDEFQQELREDGYSDDDLSILTIMALFKVGNLDNAQKEKARRCAAQWAKYRAEVAKAQAKNADTSGIVPPLCPEPK